VEKLQGTRGQGSGLWREVHGCIVEEENVDNTRKPTGLILKNNGSTEHTESLVDSVDRDMSTEVTESTERDAMKGKVFSGFSDFSGQKINRKECYE